MGPIEKAFFVIVLLEATMGVLSSFFMIICLSVKRFHKNNVGIYNKILIPLNVSNICYSITLFMNFNINFLRSEPSIDTYVFYSITYMTLYSITSYLWLAAVLCVFYFMKIMPSQPGVLTILKNRIGAVVWWLIIMAEVVSLGGGFLSIFISPPQTNQGNSSMALSEVRSGTNAQTMFMDFVLILNSLPLLTIIMTTIGSAWFLKLYDHQIKKNMMTSGNTRVRDYREAIQTMIGLLALYSIILLCCILLLLHVFSYLSLGYYICVIFLFSCATSLPGLLICGNPKLKEAIKQMFTPPFGLQTD